MEAISANRSKNLATTIIIAGLIAGLLDGSAAVISFLLKGGKDPVRIFNFIASGIFGEEGLSGGLSMAFLGLLFHMMIAMIWTIIFFFLYGRLRLYTRNWVVVGLAYGIVVWIGMNLIVVPLSNTPPMQKTVSGVMVGASILMVCIGLPIAYFANRHFKS